MRLTAAAGLITLAMRSHCPSSISAATHHGRRVSTNRLALAWSAVARLLILLLLAAFGGQALAQSLNDKAAAFAGSATVPSGLTTLNLLPVAPPKADCGSQWRTAQPTASTDKAPSLLRVSPPKVALDAILELRLDADAGASFIACLRKAGAEPVLFLDHMALPGLKPIGKFKDPDGAITVRFRLARSPQDATAWNQLLAQAWRQEGEPITVAVGIGDSAAYEASGEGASVQALFALRPVGPPLGLGLLLLAVCTLLWLIYRTELVRDREDTPAVTAAAPDQPTSGRSMSLARLLLTCWMLTVLCCIAAMLLGSGALPQLNGALGVLLTISSATAAAAAGVSVYREVAVRPSQGLWRDITHDADGLAIHRLQGLLVNGLLLSLVWQHLTTDGAILELDTNWPVLMGISGATSILGKASEAIFSRLPAAP